MLISRASAETDMDRIPPCKAAVMKLKADPSFFLIPGTQEVMGQHVFFVQIEGETEAAECRYDIGDVLNTTSMEPDVVFYLILNCIPRQIHVYLTNKDNIRRDSIGYLHVKNCSMYWRDMALYGRAIDFRVLALQEFPDTFQEELTKYGQPPQNQVYAEGLENIGTLNIIQMATNEPFFKILTNYTWLAMAEIGLYATSISLVPPNLSKTMPNLQSIEIKYAKLLQPLAMFPWDPDLLALPRNLTRSDIGNDHYSTASGMVVDASVYRRVLSLDGVQIPDLTNFTFRGFLHLLSVSQAGLNNVSEETFRHVRGLQVLDLSQNVLQVLPVKVFHGMDSLTLLTLKRNLLSVILDGTFDNMPALLTLDLSNNLLTRLDAGTFTQLRSLEELILSSNQLSEISNDAVFIHSNVLRKVSLADNLLTRVPSWCVLVRRLNTVDLSRNHISFDTFRDLLSQVEGEYLIYQNRKSASTHVTNPLANVQKTLMLRSNNISTINITGLSVDEMKSLQQLLHFFDVNLDGNTITCDCETYDFYQHFQKFVNPSERDLPNKPTDENMQWKCSLPKKVEGMPIVTVQPDIFMCEEAMSDCPHKCTCFRRNNDGGVEVNCRNHSLTEMPKSLPQGTTVLNLDMNGISVLNKRLPYSANITHLSLAHNNLTSISDTVLLDFTSLRKLALHHNRMLYLPRALEQLDLEFVALHNNPLVCDCHSKWLKYWLLSNHAHVQDMSSMVCASGKPQGKHMVEAMDSEYVCEISQAGILAISMAVFIVVATVLLVMLYYWRGEIRLLLYVHFNWRPFDKSDDKDKEKKYDAFLSYAGQDYRWVCHVLRKKFEDLSPSYRFCLHDRDFVPGVAISDNIDNAVNESRRMVVVLSRNYVKSEWCMYEFRLAHQRVMKERSNYLIVVLYEDVPVNLMEADMKLYLRTNTYLDLTNKWFWEKLAYVLPQIPLDQLWLESNTNPVAVNRADPSSLTSATPMPNSPELQALVDNAISKQNNGGYLSFNAAHEGTHVLKREPSQTEDTSYQSFNAGHNPTDTSHKAIRVSLIGLPSQPTGRECEDDTDGGTPVISTQYYLSHPDQRPGLDDDHRLDKGQNSFPDISPNDWDAEKKTVKRTVSFDMQVGNTEPVGSNMEPEDTVQVWPGVLALPVIKATALYGLYLSMLRWSHYDELWGDAISNVCFQEVVFLKSFCASDLHCI